MQTKTQSAVESIANVATGMTISYLLGMIVYPLFGFPVTAIQNAGIVAIFTAVSIARCYIWRRIFNKLHARTLYRRTFLNSRR